MISSTELSFHIPCKMKFKQDQDEIKISTMPTGLTDTTPVISKRGLDETISDSGSVRSPKSREIDGLKQSVKSQPVYSDVNCCNSNNDGVYEITQPICRVLYESKELYGFYKEYKYLRHDQVRTKRHL